MVWSRFNHRDDGDIDYRLTAPIATELCALESQGYRIDEDLLDERQRLALDGVLSISIVLDDALERTGDIQVENAGLHPERYSAAQADSLRERLIRAVDSMPTSQGPKTPHAIRRVLLKAASSELRKAKLRPIILIQLHH